MSLLSQTAQRSSPLRMVSVPALVKEASEYVVPQVDRVVLTPRPDGVAELYVEREYQHRADEQIHHWQSAGINIASSHVTEADRTAVAASTMRWLVTQHQSQVEQRYAEYAATLTGLSPFARRDPKAKLAYRFRLISLLLGDVAGITGAAIMLGEVPVLAVAQACAAGVATVTAGLVGSDLRHVHDAARRSKDATKLPETARPWAHLLRPVPPTWSLRTALGLAVTVACLMAISIGSLRTDIEGATAGVVFGGMAAAFVFASAVNAWAYADEIADVMDRAKDRLTRERDELEQLCHHRTISTHAGSSTKGQQILDEYAERGKAARLALLALQQRVLASNPQTCGHGYTAPTPEQTQLSGGYSQ